MSEFEHPIKDVTDSLLGWATQAELELAQRLNHPNVTIIGDLDLASDEVERIEKLYGIFLARQLAAGGNLAELTALLAAVLPADLPALVATLTHHIADLSATQDNLADSLAAYPPITPPNLCVGWIHQMRDRHFTLAMLPRVMHEHPDRISAELNLDAFLELSHSDRETLLATEDSARLLLEQLRHDDYRGPWRDDTHEDWGERYGLLACQHYLKSKTDVPDDNYQRLAASLPVNDRIAALITERLRTLPTDHPKHEDIAELAEYYRQKSRFAALLP